MRSIIKFINVCCLTTAALLLVGCSSVDNSNSNSVAEQRKAESERTKQERRKALSEFVDKSYRGYQIKGVAGDSPDDSCGDGETCQVHLVKSEENKIITVVIKKFQQDDGTDYWFVYEPTKLELSRIRIRKLKNESFENGKEAEREEQAEIAAAQEAEDEERKADNGFYP